MLSVRSVYSAASKSREAAHQTQLALNRISRTETDTAAREEIQALRLRIAHCNSLPNIFVRDTGEYISTSRYWRCGSKLCPDCLAAQSRKNRKKLRSALQQQQLLVGDKLSFVTLTMVNPRLPLPEARAVIDRAWSMFRKRKLCVDLISGGAKSEEFTLTKSGYHYHLHLIIRHKYMLFAEFRRNWTECVERAFNERKLKFDVRTSDKLLWVKFVQVTERERSIQELCKYVTKSDSWQKIPTEDLRSVALMRRWSRMFELFGKFRDKTIVHTAHLSDAEGGAMPRRQGWRDRLRAVGLTIYSVQLAREVVEARDFQRRAIERREPNTRIYQFQPLQ